MNPCAAINDLLPFQGSPFGQLGYFSKFDDIARPIIMDSIPTERAGFEPAAPFGVTGFQDQLLKPLGHLSSAFSVSLRLSFVTQKVF